MTPGARLAAAIDALEKISSSDLPPGEVIGAYFKHRRYAGSKDRRAISDQIYRILRHRARLDWSIDQAKGEKNDRTRAIADLVREGETPEQEIHGLFSGGKYHPTALSEEEEALATRLSSLSPPNNMPSFVAGEYPDWLESSFLALWGEGLAAHAEAFNAPAPVDLRTNALLAERPHVQALLAEDGITTTPTPYSPWGLRVEGRAKLDSAAAFRKGLVEVQDEGSQIATFMCDVKPDMMVVDFCAGAGGKTLGLAALMKNQGRLIALDVAPNRLKRMDRRLGRAQVSIVECLALEDPESEENGTGAWIAENHRLAERVLVDAPCSGIGRWRRDPTARWRLSLEEIKKLSGLQASLLANASALVKMGGRMIYVTCSPLYEENELVIEPFLEKHSGFSKIPPERIWSETLDAPFPGQLRNSGALRLDPASTGCDGFCIHILERTA
jgi:16S rRNA (cytosine967-C5)-methyltransferase